ncbi:Acyltransferase mokF [Colletotrichum sp. SAR 10_70]|nr:Acyltransferase mokF [Colletotrichum sp. SAR 10_71]KAI8172994.1 Acyltransferase mokF [Colletotrichum sp. SAR 10_70]KAI8182423.1 Acyltransferase mokF [Colletotrichum sp. SAR 10_65]KAI8220771.1 Acyltransferase mokF [Colletotrichum sp. SAR 10_86]KAI8247901.1 Acyltransferase mokF [Colletotrichum sp. SAR 10_77]
MSTFGEKITAAVNDGILPGVVLYAKDKSGRLNYSQVINSQNVPHVPAISSSSTLWLASATKIVTTIAALQLVERNIVTLDEDISNHLPALASQQVLTGFTSSNEPILSPRKNPITLRQLLSHSAGTGYDFLSPEIQRWQILNGKKPVSGSNVEERFSYPFLYEPGTHWAYSNAIDWTGRLVEVLTGQDLETYMRQNIFEPLNLESFTFNATNVEKTLWPLSTRHPETGKVIPYTGRHLNNGVESPLGGQGLHGRMDEYIEILYSLLIDDGKLLRPETTAEMFKPQLSSQSKKALLHNMKTPQGFVGDFPDTKEYDWGLGGILIDGDSHPYRKKGTLIWSGAANIFWWVDRETGVCGLFGTQIMPAGELVTKGYIKAFEEEIYARAQAL